MDGAKSECANPYTSLYEIPVTSIGGGSVSMSEYRGLTDRHYAELVQIERQYSSQGVQILAFPCNQFGAQEPGSDEEVLSFVRSKGANFPVFSKTEVNGAQACNLYKFLRLNSSLESNPIRWNFAKFLVNRDASKIEYYGPEVNPLDVVQHFTKFI